MKDYAKKDWLKDPNPDWYEWAMIALCGALFALMAFLELSK